MTKLRIIAPSDSWSTNRDFYEALDQRFHFDPFDPCPIDCPEFQPLQKKKHIVTLLFLLVGIVELSAQSGIV